MTDVDSKLEQIAEEQDKDVEWVRTKYEEKLEETKDQAASIVAEEEIQGLALRRLNSSFVEQERVGGGGDRTEILAIGHTGEQKWSNDDGGKKRIVKSYGIINPEQGPPGIAVFINDETTGVDLGEVRNNFQPLNTMVGWYRVSQSDNLSNVYMCNSTDKTRLEQQNVEGIPDDRGDRRQLLHKLADKVEIANIPNQVSMTNEAGYPVDFGADLKMVSGSVKNRYVNQEKNFGTMKIMDASVVGHEDLDGIGVMGDNDRVPGLTVWCNPEEMKYGVDSELEIYGQIRVVNSGANEGQIVMDSYGIVDLVKMPIQEDEDEAPSGANDNVTETKI